MKFGFQLIAQTISYELEALLGFRVYVAIVDVEGNYYFKDPIYPDENAQYLGNIAKSIFKTLNVGDSSQPILNENILFFKTTPSTITMLYTSKGNVDQLHAFKETYKDHYKNIEQAVEYIGFAEPFLPESKKITETSSKPQNLMSFDEFITSKGQQLNTKTASTSKIQPITNETYQQETIKSEYPELNAESVSQSMEPDGSVVYSTPKKGFLAELKTKLKEKSEFEEVQVKIQPKTIQSKSSKIESEEILTEKPAVSETNLLMDASKPKTKELLTDKPITPKKQLITEEPEFSPSDVLTPVPKSKKEGLLTDKPITQKEQLITKEPEFSPSDVLTPVPKPKKEGLLTNKPIKIEEKLLVEETVVQEELLIKEPKSDDKISSENKPESISKDLLEEKTEDEEEKEGIEVDESESEEILTEEPEVITKTFHEEGEFRENEAASSWIEEIRKKTKTDREKQKKEELDESSKDKLEEEMLEDIVPGSKSAEIKEESSAEAEVSSEQVQEPTTPPNLLLRRSFFETIKPIKDKSPKKNLKLTMLQGAIMEDSNGERNLVQMLDENKMNYSTLVKNIDFLTEEKLIKFPEHEFVKVNCPECKKEAFLFIPKFLKENCTNYIRAQVFPLECDHTFIALFDKKLKVISKPIQKLMEKRDVLDITDVNLQTLVSYLGQDMTFYIFHEVFYEKNIIFIGPWEKVQYIVAYINSIFTDYATNPVITSIDRAEFEMNSKKYKDDFVIDLNSLISLDPSDKELTFGFQVSLFLESPESFENFYKTHMRGK